ncbi:ras guanine nucleotide exchange factor domain-containing protein [Crassisporium funariophilum]|nr:ras guanine nucleotide exchange factor domain-containing protein [Crassisporium funariophilum]
MSIQSLLAFSGVPGLDAAVSILTATYAAIENVKVYKQQCGDMSGRCVSLMVALRDSSRGLEGTKVIELADEIEAIISNIDRKVKEWSSWSRLKSFLQQREIKDGIDRLHRDIDAAMMKFNMQINMEMSRSNLESKAIQERDKAEIREVLQVIVRSTDDMRALLNMQSSRDSRPVEEMMESLQTELMDPTLKPNQEQTFKAGLWLLHEKTSKLPPLTDLTGQVTMTSNNTIAKGSFNDIFLGRWLDEETRFQREVSIWREVEHPNIVPLYGIIYKDDDLYSVSPWMDNGTAIAYVKKYPTVDRLKILTEAAYGLEYLHSQGIVHGDLRGANVLISKEGTARLCDFGLSKFLEDCGKGMTMSNSINPRWFAPELLKQTGPVSTHSDVWSFAMTCLEILSGEQPFSNITLDIAVMRNLDKGKLPDRPGRLVTAQGLTDDMWALMRRCWHEKPKSRPSIADVKTALLEIRELVAPIDSKPTPSRRWTRFSKGSTSSRPSTASSDISVMSSGSAPMIKTSFISSSRIQETDELSPLDFSKASTFGRNATFVRRDRQNSSSTQAPSVFVDFGHSGSPLPPKSPQSSQTVDFSKPPRLEVPHLSASLPARLGSFFPPERSTSYGGQSSPNKSILSTDSGVHLAGPVREAVADPRSIVNSTESGIILSGTMEGLVQRLIANFNVRKDLEYRDILLTACADFTTPEDLFGVLSRRFYEAESSHGHPEDRVALQYNIFMVIMYWLEHRQLAVDQQLLWQMRNFCESAIRMKSSPLMVNKAQDLIHLIEERARDHISPSIIISPGRKMLQASQIKPLDLAVALTLLEGDKYKALVPSDYIAHLRRHPGYNNIEGAYTTNNKIISWVKDSILHYDAVEHRADVLKFFIHTAQECRKLRNFSSLVAIASALHSAPIERLKLTKAELTLQMQGKLDSLDDIINPSSNHRGYREALNEFNGAGLRDRCIPWLAVHLKELHMVLQHNPVVVQEGGRPLINFQRYTKFMDRIKEVVHYEPPDLERYRQQGQLAYLDHQLHNVNITPTSDDDFLTRSKMLEARESIDYKSRRRQLRMLGFRTT